MCVVSVSRPLAVVLAVVLMFVSTASLARTRSSQAELVVVVAVDEVLQDRRNSRFGPGKVAGAAGGAALARVAGRNSKHRNAIAALGGVMGTVVGESYDRREVRGWMVVVQYADGRLDKIETARRPNVVPGDAAYVSRDGAITRAPGYVNGDSNPQIMFRTDSRANGESTGRIMLRTQSGRARP